MHSGWPKAALGAALVTLAACAKIVGIVDTEVAVRPDGGTGVDAAADALDAGHDASATGADATVESGTVSPPGDGGDGADAAGGPADASLDQESADAGPCAANATRCGAAGRETCSASQWTSSPCPVNQPTCSNGACTVRGPTMVEAAGYYIDSTEVTSAQYQVFLAAKGGDTSGQPAVCAWNASYHDSSVAFNPDTWPMTRVDWCDALAYCTWADKHLCGTIGGGPIAVADLFVSSKSQWYQACGGGGFDVNSNPKCNSSGGTNDMAAVATFPGCEGYYPGLFDMEGNAFEWVDSCDSTDAGATDTCHLAGGSYLNNTSDCAAVDDEPRNESAYPFGFRCCGG